MSPIRRANQDYRLRKAYRANGFTVSDSGRVLTWPQQLRRTSRPSDLSKPPSPRRTSTMISPPPVHKQVATYDEIPIRLRPVYELGPLGWYEPTPVGVTIGAYRSARTKEPDREPVAPLTKLTRREWTTLLSVAEAGEERAYFVRSFVSKRIKLKD
jgi:hypothetical protein